ncbi:Inorganic pyrophosphatase [Candidatus Erwinia haradaeae]|uniref:Inorganic pyrophosphatase n=1 Tax=Candidatus Erwinia haradaeae TaxID=1922217 RepID=A0A451CZB0_9GAMM|nr:inorganic diphosphatase [Candidatus Erwinia haradaeae]VFP78485.1 Inorganic pyrophosphatase [Candidatus Erwinia haradaeae]
MNLKSIPSGKDFPHDIYVIIEIPAHSYPIKYEVDKNTGVLFVDRFVATTMFYPCNYGYVNNTFSLDGDPVDVLVPTPYPLQIGSAIRSRPIGLLKMSDESGQDDKIIAVPVHELSKEYDYMQDISDLPDLLQKQIMHFFEHYKELEKGKWVKINGWESIEAAKEELISCHRRFNAKKE